MIIYSEKTKKNYKSVEECVEAEAAFDKEKEEQRKAQETERAKHDEKEKAVRAAYDKVQQAAEEYYALLKEYYRDYGDYKTHNSQFSTVNDILRYIAECF